MEAEEAKTVGSTTVEIQRNFLIKGFVIDGQEIYNSRNSKELLDRGFTARRRASTTVEIQRNFLIIKTGNPIPRSTTVEIQRNFLIR